MGRIPADDFVGRRVTKAQQKRCEQSNTFALVRTSINQLVECNVPIYGGTAIESSRATYRAFCVRHDT